MASPQPQPQADSYDAPAFSLTPLSVQDANRHRAAGGPVYVADEHPGFPCRQCLHDAQVGEELILVSHDPFGDSAAASASPYRSASPIFLHRHDCAGEPTESAAPLPRQLTRRQLSVRAFDAAFMMTRAELVDGAQLDATIAQLFSDPEVGQLHVHNSPRGCWAVNIDRPVSLRAGD